MITERQILIGVISLLSLIFVGLFFFEDSRFQNDCNHGFRYYSTNCSSPANKYTQCIDSVPCSISIYHLIGGVLLAISTPLFFCGFCFLFYRCCFGRREHRLVTIISPTAQIDSTNLSIPTTAEWINSASGHHAGEVIFAHLSDSDDQENCMETPVATKTLNINVENRNS